MFWTFRKTNYRIWSKKEIKEYSTNIHSDMRKQRLILFVLIKIMEFSI